MRIGIETELNSYDLNQHMISEYNGLSFNSFQDLTPEVGVKMSEEYYNTTIEYNFTPFDLSKRVLGTVTDYLEEQIERFDLQVNGDSPAYVGTHVHIFEESLISLNKPRLLKVLLSFILDNLDGVSDSSKQRLFNAHQIWTNWSHNNNHSWYRKLEEFGINPNYYNSNRSRRKYGPIIISPETSRGKPRSLEIRLIPNEYIFNGKIYNLLKEIKDGTIYDRTPVEVPDFVEKLALDIGYTKRRQSLSTIWIDDLERARDTLSSFDTLPTEMPTSANNNHFNSNFDYPYCDSTHYLGIDNNTFGYNKNDIFDYTHMLYNVRIIPNWNIIAINSNNGFKHVIEVINPLYKRDFTNNVISLLSELSDNRTINEEEKQSLIDANRYKDNNYLPF